MIELSVIVVNWNLSRLLKRCLASVAASADGMTYEIIVVDNASSDDSLEMLKKGFPEVRVIANVRNVGFGKANNQGFSVSKGQFILLLNPDARLLKNSLNELTRVLQEDAKIGITGPKIVNSDGSVQAECLRMQPTLTGELKYLLRIDRLKHLMPLSNRLTGKSRDYDRAQDAEVISGSCMLIRRATFEDIGGFDERFFMYAEDVDLCRASCEHGWRVYYTPAATVIHQAHEAARKSRSFSPAAVSCHSMYLYFRKHAGGVTASLYRLLVGLASGAWLVVFGVTLQFLKQKPAHELSMYHEYQKLKWALSGKQGFHK